eukprot:m.96692 g.96692  ORF g.96692 m.96692 type:complete len:388 (+) comp14804_c0_seq2:764-1927(+)
MKQDVYHTKSVPSFSLDTCGRCSHIDVLPDMSVGAPEEIDQAMEVINDMNVTEEGSDRPQAVEQADESLGPQVGPEYKQCTVCLDDLDEGENGWQCPHPGCKLSVCIACTNAFLQHHEQQQTLQYMRCPGCCRLPVVLQDVLESFPTEGYEEIKVHFTSALELERNPLLRRCPACGELNTGNPRKPKMTCTSCQCVFCYYHDLNHAGRGCGARWIRPDRYLRTKWYLWRHTHYCLRCGRHFQREQECTTITCACGFVMCRHCGRAYTNSSLHGQRLFPRPSHLKYQCNNPALWAKRVAVVIFGFPGLLLLGAAITCSAPCIGMYQLGSFAHTTATKYKKRRQQRRPTSLRSSESDGPHASCHSCLSRQDLDDSDDDDPRQALVPRSP